MIEREIIQIVTGFDHKQVVPLDQIDPRSEERRVGKEC